MRAAMQERTLQIVLGVIQAGALERMPLRIVGALRAPMRAGAVHCDVAAVPGVDEEEIDLSALIDDPERRPGAAQFGDASEIYRDPAGFEHEAGSRQRLRSAAEWRDASHGQRALEEMAAFHFGWWCLVFGHEDIITRRMYEQDSRRGLESAPLH
jgi:hypothetical protein